MTEQPKTFPSESGPMDRPTPAGRLDMAGTQHVIPGEPTELGPTSGDATDLTLSYETGVEMKTRSQWAYARRRFLRHRLAMGSLVVLVGIILAAVFAHRIAPYAYDEIDLSNISAAPTTEGKHYFGTDLLGRDYFSRVLFGVRTSIRVAFIVALLSTLVGTAMGAISGYFGGLIDNLLMRITDLGLTLPLLAVLLTVSALAGGGS